MQIPDSNHGSNVKLHRRNTNKIFTSCTEGLLYFSHQSFDIAAKANTLKLVKRSEVETNASSASVTGHWNNKNILQTQQYSHRKTCYVIRHLFGWSLSSTNFNKKWLGEWFTNWLITVCSSSAINLLKFINVWIHKYGRCPMQGLAKPMYVTNKIITYSFERKTFIRTD